MATTNSSTSLTPNRRSAAVGSGNGTTGAENGDQTLNSSPSTHTRAGKTSQDVQGAEGVNEPALHVTTDPTLHAAVVLGGDASDGVEALTGELGTVLDGPANEHNTGKGVGEVQTEQTTNEADDTTQVGNGGGNQEGDDPVERSHRVPHPATLLGGDVRHVEDLLQDLDVDCLHANVEVENWRLFSILFHRDELAFTYHRQ